MSEELQKVEQNSVTVLNESLEQFKALFYLAKGKRDTQIKLYNENKVFNRQNVIDLNDKIEQKLLNYSVVNKLTSITINLSKNNIKSYGNWQEFLNEKWETGEKTETVTIDWDFEMLLPNRVHTLPQTHSLKVRMGNKLKPNEIFHIMMTGGEEFDLEESQAQLVAKVDFINNSIATELLAIVSEWYNSLPENVKDNNINNFFGKHWAKLRMAMEVLIIMSGIMLVYPIAKYFLPVKVNSVNFVKCNFTIFAGIFIAFSIFSRTANYYSRKVDSKVNKLTDYPYFMLTSGDQNELAKNEKKNKGIRREIILKLAVTLICTIIISVFVYCTHLLKSLL
jgi:hypothetical protein